MLLFSPEQSITQNKECVGGKAYGLALLYHYGIKTPPWCVIRSSELKKRQSQEGFHFSLNDRKQISLWLERQKQKGAKSFIVRSSLGKEDGKELSFAGQLESYPHLQSLDDILEKITLCAKSACNFKMKAYSKEHLLDTPSVIIQVMSPSEISGVLFTAHPQTGSRLSFVISSTWGHCEAVVKGLYDCDEFLIHLSPFKIESRLSSKDKMLELSTVGLKEVSVPEEKINVPSLSKEQISKLVNIGKFLTYKEKQALDIEWVITNNQIVITQMRPLTNLKSDTSETSQFVFDNSNIQESFNGLTKPLTFYFAREAYRLAYNQLMEVMGFSGKIVQAHNLRHKNMISLVKGRVYYNINSWYEGLLFLPSFGRNKADMEYMMGIEDPVDFISDQVLSFKEKLRKFPLMLKVTGKLMWQFVKIDKLTSDFLKKFHKTFEEFPREKLMFMDSHSLLKLLGTLHQNILQNWKAPLINDFYVMMFSGKIRKTLKKIQKESFIPRLLAAEELESTNPTKQLIAISEIIKNDENLKQILFSSHFERLFFHKKLQKELESFLNFYGDRVAGELKLETKTLREDPSFLFKALRAYVKDETLSLKNLNKEQKLIQKKAEDVIFQELKEKLGYFRLYQFKKNLKSFRKATRLRESMRLSRTQSFGMTRSIYLALGQKLKEQGWTNEVSDIFYLTPQELEDFFHSQAVFDSPKAVIELRKKQYKVWSKQELPSQIKSSLPLRAINKKKPKESENSENKNFLKGLGCYPGKITAQVVVLRKPDFDVDLKDKILVTERTDPGWTPLFVHIKGLLVEKGSQLSHSAIIARELGLPTIVSIKDLCHKLKTGDIVSMDSEEGSITLCNKKDLSLAENKDLLV